MMSARASPSLGRLRRGAKPALASRPIVRASAQGKGSTDDYVVTLVNIAVTAGNEEGFVAQSVDNASNSVEVTAHPTKPTEPTEPTARSHSDDTIDRSTVPTHSSTDPLSTRPLLRPQIRNPITAGSTSCRT